MANVSIRKQVAPFLTHNQDGSIDLDGSTAKFTEALLTLETASEGDTTLINDALTAVFDQYHGQRITSQALTAMVVARVQASNPALNDPSLFKSLSAQVSKVLHSNPAYSMRKGSGGGWGVVAHLPTKE